jgi:hypothetical protein
MTGRALSRRFLIHLFFKEFKFFLLKKSAIFLNLLEKSYQTYYFFMRKFYLAPVSFVNSSRRLWPKIIQLFDTSLQEKRLFFGGHDYFRRFAV